MDYELFDFFKVDVVSVVFCEVFIRFRLIMNGYVTISFFLLPRHFFLLPPQLFAHSFGGIAHEIRYNAPDDQFTEQVNSQNNK